MFKFKLDQTKTKNDNLLTFFKNTPDESDFKKAWSAGKVDNYFAIYINY